MNLRITTLAKNESDRFLSQLLPIWRQLGEVWCMIDGTSHDVEATIELCEAHGCAHTVYKDGWTHGESPMRQAQFDWVRPGAEWVVHLDADHCPAGDFRPHLHGKRVKFYVFDMWNASQYRSDRWWRVRPWWEAVNLSDSDLEWTWTGRHLHGGHLPSNVNKLVPAYEVPRECGLLHFGYSTPELRSEHHRFYMDRSEHLSKSQLFHADTIISPNPRLKDLDFEPEWRVKLP